MEKKKTIDNGFEIIDTFSDDEDQNKQNIKNKTQTPQQTQDKKGTQNQQRSPSQSQGQKTELADIEKNTEKKLFDEDDTEVLRKNISKIYTIKFSQTGKTVAIGTEDGLRIQSTEKGKEDRKYILEKEQFIFQSGVKHVSLMYDTFICALVTDNRQKQYPDTKVYIWDQINKQIISEFEFYSPVLSIVYMREYLLVASDKRLVIYDIVQKKPLKYVLDIFAPYKFQGSQLYDSFTYCYLSNTKGKLYASNIWFSNPVLIDFNQEIGQPTPQQAEQKILDISNIVLSPDGSLMAICERGGHVIKIFDTEKGKLKCTLYRGQKPKVITDMQFKKDLTAFGLISTSDLKSDDEGTIHIFDISLLNSQLKHPIEKFKDIYSIQFNFEVQKKQSHASKDSKIQGPLIQFDQSGSNTFTIYSDSDYTITEKYDLTSNEPKKKLDDNFKAFGWIDPIQDN